MPSLDAKLRTALYDHLKAWPTGAKTVVTYQVAPFRLDHMPVLDVEVGGWTQQEVGNSLRGQRVYERTYTVNVSVVDNTQAADFAESVNAIADQVVRAASQFDAIPFDLQDLTVGAGEYHPVDCATEEGRGGALTLVCSATVLVNEAKPDVPMGRRREAPSSFPPPPF